MSNKPDDPNAPKPDAGRVPGPEANTDSDSVLDVSLPAGDVENSGISVHEWAALVDDSIPLGEPASSVKIDSPSDADLLGSPPTDAAIDLGSEAVASMQPDSQVRLGDAPSMTFGSDSSSMAHLLADSGVNLDDAPRADSAISLGEGAELSQEVMANSPSDSAIDLSSSHPGFSVPLAHESDVDLAADAAAAVRNASDSAIDLTGDAIEIEVADPSGGSAIDLPADVIVEEEVVDLSQEDVLAMTAPSESGIDLADAVPPTQGGSSVRPLAPGESGVDLLAEDVILEEPAAPTPPTGSSRDLIAEGLESGVDLMGKGKGRRGARDSEDALEEMLAQVADDQSSSVDLGSSHAIDVFGDSPSHPSGADAVAEAPIDLENVVVDNLVDDLDLETIAGEKSPAPRASVELPSEPDAIDLNAIEDGVEAAVEAEGADLRALAVPSLDKPAKVVARPEDDVNLGEIIDEPVEEGVEQEKVEVNQLVNPDVDVPPEPGKKKPKKKKDDSSGEVATVEPDKKTKPVKQKSRVGSFVFGGFLMALAASVGYAAVWVTGMEPPGEWRDAARETVGMEKMAKANVGPGDKTGGDKTAPPEGIDKTLEFVRNGDLDKVNEAKLTGVNDNDASQLVARADYFWTKYLRDQRGQKLDAKAEPVSKAMADLKKAADMGNADALLLRGQIHQMTNNPAEARKDFASGLDKFKADPAVKERFDAALATLDVGEKIAKLLPPEIPPHLVAVVLISLQAEQPKNDPPKMPGEAGIPFLQALKAKKDGKYSEALALLADAKKRHDERRFLLPRKPQNPGSDAREAIFLYACDQLEMYWSMLNGLKDPAKYLAADKGRNAAVDAVLTAGRTELVKDAGERMFKDKVKDKPAEKLEDLVTLLAADRKVRDDKITTLDKTVTAKDKEIELRKTELESLRVEFKATSDKLIASLKREDDLKASLNAADALLTKVAGAIGTKFATVKADGKMLVKDASEAAELAKNKDPDGTIKKQKEALSVFDTKLKQRWEPAEMLPYWLAILEGDRTRADLHAAALKDVRRVLDDKAATEADKGRARAIEGLVQRNEDKFAASEATLKGAKDALTEAKAKQWLDVVDVAIKEVSDPAGTVARRADELAGRNRTSEALAVLKKGLEVVPDRKGELLARRARIGLDGLISAGKLDKDAPEVIAVRKDATDAAGEGLAEGHYVLGRLDEELGNVKEAVTSYRAALKANKAGDETAGRYTAALARALAKATPRGAGVRPLPPADRIGKLTPKDGRDFADVELSAILMLFTLQAPDLPAEDVSEAEQLANAVLKMGNKAPFDATAQALVVKRLYTRALTTYVSGLRDKGLLAPQHSNALLDLVRIHPGMKPPTGLDEPAADPLAGEKAYASGLNFYTKKKYAEAEREFKQATLYDGGDARYFYYLGLARLAQGNRDGYEDFDTAARLERLGRPNQAAVSKALERVQGPWRKALNDVRERPVKDRLK